jgi:hypothetical protein
LVGEQKLLRLGHEHLAVALHGTFVSLGDRLEGKHGVSVRVVCVGAGRRPETEARVVVVGTTPAG